MSDTTMERMIKAPMNAIYIWPVMASIHHVKALAQHFNRSDLQIFTPEYFDGQFQRECYRPVVLDPATKLTASQYESYQYHCATFLRMHQALKMSMAATYCNLLPCAKNFTNGE